MQIFVARFDEVSAQFREAHEVVHGEQVVAEDVEEDGAMEMDRGVQDDGAEAGQQMQDENALPPPQGVLAADHHVAKKNKYVKKAGIKVQQHTGGSAATGRRAMQPVKAFVTESVSKSSPKVAEHILKKLLLIVVSLMIGMPDIGVDGVTETIWSTIYGNRHGGGSKFSGSSKVARADQNKFLSTVASTKFKTLADFHSAIAYYMQTHDGDAMSMVSAKVPGGRIVRPLFFVCGVFMALRSVLWCVCF